MACLKRCSGLSICEGNIPCIQIINDGGNDCIGIAEGYSRLQIDANGNLEVCSNVGGNCSCTTLTGGGGTDSLVNNNDGTFTHTAVDGTVVIIDVCDLLQYCDPGALGTDTLVDNGDGTYTHTAVDGTIVTIDVCAALAFCDLNAIVGSDTLVDNGDGTFTHTDLDGNPVTFDVCNALQFCDIENIGNVDGGQTINQFLVWNGTNYVPTDPYLTAVASAVSGGFNFQDPGGPVTIPAGTTAGLIPVQAQITNTSPTRNMLVQIVFTGYEVDFSIQRSAPGITFGWAVQPTFFIDGVPQNNPFATDRIATMAGAQLTTYENDAPTNSWTTTVVLVPGQTVIARMEATFINQIAHNADISARIQGNSGTISLQGMTI